jgi:hypothetical protein
MTLYIVAGIILAVGGFILWLYLAGKSAGATAATHDVLEETAEVLRKQAQAQADAPQGKQEVIDRLRTGGGL